MKLTYCQSILQSIWFILTSTDVLNLHPNVRDTNGILESVIVSTRQSFEQFILITLEEIIRILFKLFHGVVTNHLVWSHFLILKFNRLPVCSTDSFCMSFHRTICK